MRNLLSHFLFGLLFACCGVGVFLVFGSTTSLSCERVEPRQVSCLRQVRLLGFTVREETLPRVFGATIDESCDSDGCTYRVVLQTEAADMPLTAYYSSGLQRKEQVVSELNAFLADVEQPSLVTGDSAGPWIWLFPILFVGVGLLVAFQPVWSLLRGR